MLGEQLGAQGGASYVEEVLLGRGRGACEVGNEKVHVHVDTMWEDTHVESSATIIPPIDIK